MAALISFYDGVKLSKFTTGTGLVGAGPSARTKGFTFTLELVF